MWIAYLHTNEGPVIVAAAGSLSDPTFDQQLSLLASQERGTTVIDSPSRLFDDQSEVLTPFSDEG